MGVHTKINETLKAYKLTPQASNSTIEGDKESLQRWVDSISWEQAARLDAIIGASQVAISPNKIAIGEHAKKHLLPALRKRAAENPATAVADKTELKNLQEELEKVGEEFDNRLNDLERRVADLRNRTHLGR